jgi:hypothetical protein
MVLCKIEQKGSQQILVRHNRVLRVFNFLQRDTSGAGSSKGSCLNSSPYLTGWTTFKSTMTPSLQPPTDWPKVPLALPVM